MIFNTLDILIISLTKYAEESIPDKICYWTTGWSIAIRRVDVLIKSCGVGEKELERIHTKNFINEESENRMEWKD